jgi:hypothetical protein
VAALEAAGFGGGRGAAEIYFNNLFLHRLIPARINQYHFNIVYWQGNVKVIRPGLPAGPGESRREDDLCFI